MTTSINPIVFAYDFPHRKTQDLILRLTTLGHKPSVILAAPSLELSVQRSSLRVKARHVGLIDPQTLATSLQIPYVVVDHKSDECIMQLDLFDSTVGVIAGARILPAPVIERFSRGVVNLHPGLLPDTRGLDALQWALYRDLPLGVTAHLIDHRVDAGRLLERRLIEEYADDSFIDLSLRLYETQLDMLGGALVKAVSTPANSLDSLVGGNYNRSFPDDLVPLLKQRFRRRKSLLRSGITLARMASA